MRDPVAWLVAAIDRRARRRLGIAEFSDDKRCIFRLSTLEVQETVQLSDGTVLHPGDRAGMLHLANERMPVQSTPGGGMGWGKRLAARYVHSLRLLAERVAEDPELAAFEAYGNDFTLPYRAGTKRVIERVGFDVLDPVPRRGLTGFLAQLGVSLWTKLLRRAHSPMSLEGLRLKDLETRPVWITRRTLLERYRPAAKAPLRPATPRSR